jgi:AraC-like DNA-binding protein
MPVICKDVSEINIQADNTLWPAAVWVGDVVYPPGSTLGPRIQPTIELVMLHSGEMSVWIDDVRHDAPVNTVSILFPGHVERFVFAEHTETRHSFMHIDVPNLSKAIEARLRRLPWILPLSPQMNDLIQEGLTLRHSTLPTAGEMLKALGTLMLWRYLGEAERERNGDTLGLSHVAVSRAQQYIQMHLNEVLTLDMIAGAAAVSPTHLIRLFHAQLHTTPIAYLWEQRIALGVELLENTGLSVGMIAERCGFQTSYHFSRRVRHATGLAPLDVRRRAWQR